MRPSMFASNNPPASTNGTPSRSAAFAISLTYSGGVQTERKMVLALIDVAIAVSLARFAAYAGRSTDFTRVGAGVAGAGAPADARWTSNGSYTLISSLRS